MKLSYLKKIINIKDINNIEKNINFDYFRITNLENRLFIKAKHVLFFPFYISQQDLKNGWYLNKYDLRKHILEIYDKHPNYTFVIEENMLVDVPDCMHFIVVDNIMLTIDKIFDFMLSEFKGKTILVTGSVGKTSTVGMLESVLKASNKSVLRIYSKRITPLVLKSYIINFVTPELEYIVMEARMFYKKYIPYFSKTMKPYLSIILNVEKEHLGVNGIDTIDDIVENKAELIRYSKYAIVNGRDERLSKLKHKSNSIYYKNKKLFDTDLSQLKIWKNYNELIQPYINTYLSVVMSNIVFEASKILKLDSNTYIHSINHFTPVENRLSKQIIYDKEIIFDGEVSGVSRLKMLCNHFYKKAVIIIRTFTYEGEENENYELLKTSLLNFEKVYLFENVKEKDLLTERNTIIVSNHDFIKNISKDCNILSLR